jgi:hypothetical protein
MRHRPGYARKLVGAQRRERLDVGEEVGDLLEALVLGVGFPGHARRISAADR